MDFLSIHNIKGDFLPDLASHKQKIPGKVMYRRVFSSHLKMEKSIALLQNYQYRYSTSYLNAKDLQFALYAFKWILKFILRCASKTP